MRDDVCINVHHLTRVEGHGNITVSIKEGRIEDIRFAVVEAPRLFEVFLRGQSYEDLVHLASRICGICAVSHRSAALKATEAAFGVVLSDQSILLRRLALHGEFLSSHILHAYFLAAPDFLGLPSVFPLIEREREIVERALRMKELAYDLCKVVAGRHTHPVAMTVGGFSFVHAKDGLFRMRDRLAGASDDFRATVEFFKKQAIPRFERATDFVSLRHPEYYAFYEGEIYSSGAGTMVPVKRYREVIEEYVVPYSTAKHAKWSGRSYMVGALARVNNNFDRLKPRAKEAALDLGLSVPCLNPFMNTLAQVVECLHCLEESIEIIDELLSRGIRADEERAEAAPRAGSGIGALEAPRGLLFHEYTFDSCGVCLSANQVIPTAQNLSNMEADMRALLPLILDESEDSITRQLEMLARSYDLCISCSTHVVHL